MKREQKGNRRRESTRLTGVVSDYYKRSSSTDQKKRPKRGIALQVKISDFNNFDSALKVFNVMTLDVTREVKERQFYKRKLTRGARKLKGKRLEKRNKEMGYVE